MDKIFNFESIIVIGTNITLSNYGDLELLAENISEC